MQNGCRGRYGKFGVAIYFSSGDISGFRLGTVSPPSPLPMKRGLIVLGVSKALTTATLPQSCGHTIHRRSVLKVFCGRWRDTMVIIREQSLRYADDVFGFRGSAYWTGGGTEGEGGGFRSLGRAATCREDGALTILGGGRPPGVEQPGQS